MAILSKLRNSSLVLIIVLVSLGLFVASDYFSSSNKYGFSGSQAVGEIDGKEITLQEFDAGYKDVLDKMEKNGTPETEDTRTQASNYAWDIFIQKMIVDKEYEKLGIDISVDESSTLLYSDNPHQYIQQFFSRFSEDGVFSPANVLKAKNAAKKDENVRQFFENIVSEVFKTVQNRKYTSIIAKSVYATTLDVEDDFYNSSVQINGKAVTVLYTTIEDKTIKVTDAELKSYIAKHKEDFKQVNSRDIEYVLVNIAPSKDDTLSLKEEMAADMANFSETEDDSLYTALNGTTPYDGAFKSRGSMNKDVESMVFSAPKDSVVGPVYYDGGYSIYKVTGVKEDSLAYYHVVKAEIPVKGTTKADTAEAMALGKRLGAESKSAGNSLDFFNSKTNTGELSYAYDLGWVKDGSQQPEEINKAIRSLGPGESTVVKTMYGLSIIKLVEPKSNKLVQVAEVRRLIEPLKSTEDASFSKALNFRNTLTDKKDEFEAKAQKAGLAKSVANNVKESDRTMTAIPGTLEVIRWAFAEERKEGDYSDVIATGNMLIVAHLSRIKKEGTAEVEDVRDKVTKLVINEKKAEIIKTNFANAMKGGKSIEDIATALKTQVQPFNNINFNTPNVQFAGNDAKLVGYICGMKPKDLSKPITSFDGVHVFYVESVNRPEIPAEYRQNKQNVFAQKKQQMYNITFEALKKKAKVKDERYKFY
jgi:peptidyl-prolyl cis-trans isomerase D